MIIYKKLENIQEFLDCINGGDIVFKMSFSLYDDGSSIDVDLKKYCELSKEGYKELTGMDKIDVDIFTAI